MPDQKIQDIIAKGIAAGLNDDDISLAVDEYKRTQPKPTESGVMPDEDWATLSGGEKMRNVLQWGGKAIGGAFLGPGASEAVENPKTTLAAAAVGPAVKYAPRVMEGVKRIAGVSGERAAANMQSASQAAKDVPVQLARASEPIGRARELQATGNRMPRVVTQLQRRIAGAGEMGFREAQDFVTSLSRLSVNERNALTPQMHRQLVTIRDAVRSSLAEAADEVGAGAQYMSGVKEYAKSAGASRFWEKAKDKLIPPLLHGAGAGTAGALMYKLFGDNKK